MFKRFLLLLTIGVIFFVASPAKATYFFNPFTGKLDRTLYNEPAIFTSATTTNLFVTNTVGINASFTSLTSTNIYTSIASSSVLFTDKNGKITGNSTSLSFDGKRLGIGTTTPGFLVDSWGNINASSANIRVTNGNPNSGAYGFINLQNDIGVGGGSSAGIYLNSSQRANDGVSSTLGLYNDLSDIRLRAFKNISLLPNNGTLLFTASSSGYIWNKALTVGSGTGAPGLTRLRLDQTDGTNAASVIEFYNGSHSMYWFLEGVATGGRGQIRTDSTRAIVLQDNASSAGGGVGIGTPNPTAKLSVLPSSGSLRPFDVVSSTQTLLIVDRNGYVGVGTSSPNKLFMVSSTTWIDTNGSLFITNANTGNSIGANGLSIASAGSNGAGVLMSSAIIPSGSAWQFFTKGAGNGDFFIGRTSVRDNIILGALTPGVFFPGPNAGSAVPAGEFSMMSSAGTNGNFVPAIFRGTSASTGQVNPLTIWQNTASTTLSVIDHNGRLGIASSSPKFSISANSTNTTNNLFGLLDHANLNVMSVVTGTIRILTDGFFDSTNGQSIIIGNAVNNTGLVLRQGAVILQDGTGVPSSQWDTQGLQIGDGVGSSTSTYFNDSIIFQKTTAKPLGSFSVNSSGGISTSSTLRTFGKTTVAATSGTTSTIEVGLSGSSKGACLVMADTDGAGFTFITANNGTLSASTNDCR